MNSTKKKFQKFLCVSLSIVSVFSMVAPVVCADMCLGSPNGMKALLIDDPAPGLPSANYQSEVWHQNGLVPTNSNFRIVERRVINYKMEPQPTLIVFLVPKNATKDDEKKIADAYLAYRREDANSSSIIASASCSNNSNNESVSFRLSNNFYGLAITYSARDTKWNNGAVDPWHYENPNLKAKLEEINKNHPDIKNLWAENTAIAFALQTGAKRLTPSPNVCVVVVPKGTSIWDAYNQTPFVRWCATNDMSLSLDHSFMYHDGGKSNKITEDKAREIRLCANQVFLPQRCIATGRIDVVVAAPVRSTAKHQLVLLREKTEERASEQRSRALARAGTSQTFVPRNRRCVAFDPVPAVAEKGFEIENGLLGMQRDIFLRLLRLAKNVSISMVRTLFGICQETFIWLQHRFAQEILCELPQRPIYEASRQNSLNGLYTHEFQWLRQAINTRLTQSGGLNECQTACEAKKKACGAEQASLSVWQKEAMPHLVNVLKSLNATCNITVRASQHNAKALANVGTELGSLQALAEGVCEDIMGVPDAQELKRIVFDYVMNKTAGAFALNFETDTRGRTVSFLPERNITLLLYYLYAYVHAPLL